MSDSNSVVEQRVAQQRCIDLLHDGTHGQFDGAATIHNSDQQAINYYPRARLTTTSVSLTSHLPGTEYSECICSPTQAIGWRVAESDIAQMSVTNDSYLNENIAAVNPELQADEWVPADASPPSPTLIKIQQLLNQKSLCGEFCLFKPYSKVLRIWLSLVSLAVLYNLWLPIARQSFYQIQTRYFLFWLVLDAVADFIYLLDIFVQMGTTYLEFGIPVLKRRKIVKHYMKTFGFRLDLLSLLPLDLIQIKVGTQPMLRFPRFIKFYRFLEWKMSIGHLCRIPCIWRLFHLFHLLFLGCHWCACLYFDVSAFEQFKSTWGFVPQDGSNTTLFRVYLVSFYWATLALATIGIDEPPTTTLRTSEIPRRQSMECFVNFWLKNMENV
ncbi:transporter, cation channel family protein [Opisthorchis viverrini]|uniref:Transporter, cation channel family protein n=1 Tax=Opisthorchis viverrini TaxID=6198 RepID=A0A1S8WNE0_OPIVI|nr:transporter, cation channel family protein [Opisthorchis viverrini]